MSHTLTVSTPITDFTFRAILKELVCLVLAHKEPFNQDTNCLEKDSQPSTGNASQAATPAVMAVAKTLQHKQEQDVPLLLLLLTDLHKAVQLEVFLELAAIW